MRGSSSGTDDKNVYRLPEDMTSEVIDTPDITAYRGFDPRAEFDVMNRSIGARLSNENQAAYDDYGAYTGIPSAVARNRMRDERINENNQNARLAIAEGTNAGNEMRANQLAGLAQLTARRRESGFRSAIKNQQQGGGIGSSLISAGAAIGTTAIIA